MNEKRKVSLSILFGLLKGQRRVSIIGLIFTALSVFVMLPLITILSFTTAEPYEKYDYKAIEQNGIEKAAKITFIKKINNVSYNGENPVVLSYKYDDGGKIVEDKFETLGLEQITTLGIDTSKTAFVFVYRNQSVIKGLEPFSFPITMFYMMPAIFLLIGLPILLIGLIPALRVYNLFKTGMVKDAYLVAVESTSGGLPMSRLKQNIQVHYYYLNEFKSKVFGKSTTTDLLAVNGKKEGDIIKIFVSEADENNTGLVPKLESMKYNWGIY
nr:hypothetical protein [uncultured Mucilaginibacter sp.]